MSESQRQGNVNKTAVQAIGSSNTYGRRYVLRRQLLRAAILDVLDSDLPWYFPRSHGDEIRLDFADAVQERLDLLERILHAL